MHRCMLRVIHMYTHSSHHRRKWLCALAAAVIRGNVQLMFISYYYCTLVFLLEVYRLCEQHLLQVQAALDQSLLPHCWPANSGSTDEDDREDTAQVRRAKTGVHNMCDQIRVCGLTLTSKLHPFG